MIWDARRSLVPVADFLAAHGVRVPPGWRLGDAVGIAVRGGVLTLAGCGTNPEDESEAWIATAPLPEASIAAGSR